MRAYWTRPGQYTIRATMQTERRPAPPGVRAGEDGFASVTLASDEVTITVISGRAGPGGER